MKKILEKIVAIALAIVSLVFVGLILTLLFKPAFVSELNNQLVKTMLISFGVLFGVLTTLNIAGAFRTVDKLSTVMLFKGKKSATKATVGVVKKYVKTATKNVEGAKVTKVMLFVDENNDVKLKADLKIKSDKEVIEVVTAVRAHVADTLMGVLGLEFKSIDFTTVGLKNKYTPKKEAIEASVAQELADIEATKAREQAEAIAEEKAEAEAIAKEQAEAEAILAEAKLAEEAVTEAVATEEIAEVEEVATEEVVEETQEDVAEEVAEEEIVEETEVTEVQAEVSEEQKA